MKGYLILGVLLVFIIWMFWKAIEAGRTPKIEHPEYTIGEIVDFEQIAKGAIAIIEYSVNEKNYKCSIKQISSMIIGEKYQVEYDIEDPNKSIVIKSKPVFLEDEKVNLTSGIVNSLSSIGNSRLSYRYTVEGIVYKKSQWYDSNFFTPKKEEQYEVEYWQQNPQRAIIHLDKPIK